MDIIYLQGTTEDKLALFLGASGVAVLGGLFIFACDIICAMAPDKKSIFRKKKRARTEYSIISLRFLKEEY